MGFAMSMLQRRTMMKPGHAFSEEAYTVRSAQIPSRRGYAVCYVKTSSMFEQSGAAASHEAGYQLVTLMNTMVRQRGNDDIGIVVFTQTLPLLQVINPKLTNIPYEYRQMFEEIR